MTTFSEYQFEDIFRQPELIPPRLGRPLLLDDAHLHNSRDHLVGVLESYWGEIGRTLRKCKKPDDLVSIFRGLARGVSEGPITALCTASSQPGIRGVLSKIRSELHGIGKPRRAAREADRNAYERLERARSALGPIKRRERKLVRKELVKRTQEAQQVAAEARRLDERENNLLALLKLAEASFARREFFRFLKSKRYELNPLNVANAAAGLPYMGWRQSMRRCSKEPSHAADGLHYQVFKSIRYLVSSSRKKTKDVLIEHFRRSIPSLPSRHRLARRELAEKWLFLDRAIRKICRAKPHPKSLPFEITKHYLKQQQRLSHADILLAERAKLSL